MRIPHTMRAAALNQFGKANVLTVREMPVPEIDAGEILIAVHTAGVGGWDGDMREGWWPDGRPKLPLVLGADGSGTVAAVGGRVRRFAPGDRVYAYSFANPKGGFYAEYVAVEADSAGVTPQGLTLRQAGAIAVVGLTALQGIDDALDVKRGEVVIVHGASGGVGSLAVQFAKMRGARVIGTATGRDGVAFVRKLGADAAADGKRADFTAKLRAFAPDGVDAVLALSGGPALTQCVHLVKRGGRVAYPNGVEPAPRKRRGITVKSYDAAAGRREFERLGKAVEAARLKVPIAASYALGATAKAHARLAKGHVLGKIVLRVRER